jgi:membrane protein implicated in regulation of membrane protease activity
MELRESFPGSAAQTFWGRDRTPTLRGVLVSSALLIACIAAASALIIVFGEHTHHQALNDALKIVQMCLVALAGLTVVVAVSIAVVRGLRTERDTDRQIRQRQEAQGRSRSSRRGTRHTVEPSDPA